MVNNPCYSNSRTSYWTRPCQHANDGKTHASCTCIVILSLVKKSLHKSQVLQQVGYYPSFCSTKRQGIFLLPLVLHLCIWVERGTMKVFSALPKNTTLCSPTRSRTRTARSEGEQYNWATMALLVYRIRSRGCDGEGEQGADALENRVAGGRGSEWKGSTSSKRAGIGIKMQIADFCRNTFKNKNPKWLFD